jgi:hypothetical protein
MTLFRRNGVLTESQSAECEFTFYYALSDNREFKMSGHERS